MEPVVYLKERKYKSRVYQKLKMFNFNQVYKKL